MSGLVSSMDWLRRLVAYDTTSRDSNRDLIDDVAAHLTSLGLEPVVLPAGDKANLLCTVPAADGTTLGGVVLSGHTDCVPVDGQDWEMDPFTVTERDGRIFGRGVCDMKGFVASALAAISTGDKPAGPIHLALSYDEEVGCLGAPALVDEIRARDLAPVAAIVGEPTSMRAILAHKSSYVVELTFTGVAAHSSLTNRGVNAIEYAAEFVRWLRTQADGWRTEGPFDEAYPVPYTTAGVNTIDGGIAQNTVPDRCVLRCEFRTVGAVNPEDVIQRATGVVADLAQRMAKENDTAGAELAVLAQVAGLESASDCAAARLVSDLGFQLSSDKVTYGTEAGIFAAAGIDAVVCGPGDIAQAHAANEYVDIDQLAACDDFMGKLFRARTDQYSG